jgi:hypothetical protein
MSSLDRGGPLRDCWSCMSMDTRMSCCCRSRVRSIVCEFDFLTCLDDYTTDVGSVGLEITSSQERETTRDSRLAFSLVWGPKLASSREETSGRRAWIGVRTGRW